MSDEFERFSAEHPKGTKQPIFFVLTKLIQPEGDYPHPIIAPGGYASGDLNGFMPAKCKDEIVNNGGMILETNNLFEMYFGLREFIAEMCIQNAAPGFYYSLLEDLQTRELETGARVALMMQEAGLEPKDGDVPPIADNGSEGTLN